MSVPPLDNSAKDRLLLAATNLMAAGADVSTREVLAAAKVTAPTLYHHFGNMQGLIDAVAKHGFAQYVTDPAAGVSAIDAVRSGWDEHMQFGLDHPRFYARLYGNVEPGTPCAVTGPALDMLLHILEPVATSGQLTVPPKKAAIQILAANVGVTLSLIGQPMDQRDADLSRDVREAVLASVFTSTSASQHANSSMAAQAVALAAGVQSSDVELSDGERAMLGELLDRIASTRTQPS